MGRRRDLAPGAVTGLNAGLEKVRGLYVPEDEALAGFSSARKSFKKEFRAALAESTVSEAALESVNELRTAVNSLPAALEQRAAYSRQARAFMERLHGLITTKMDGTDLEGSINPIFVRDSRQETAYRGDDRDLPRIYLTSDRVKGRVVDTLGQEPNPEEVEVWVWPTGVKLGGEFSGWHNGHGGSPTEAVSLLDESVEFVEHIEGCKLPKPDQYYTGHSLTFAD